MNFGYFHNESWLICNNSQCFHCQMTVSLEDTTVFGKLHPQCSALSHVAPQNGVAPTFLFLDLNSMPSEFHVCWKVQLQNNKALSEGKLGIIWRKDCFNASTAPHIQKKLCKEKTGDQESKGSSPGHDSWLEMWPLASHDIQGAGTGSMGDSFVWRSHSPRH